jgi:hypothetical protein
MGESNIIALYSNLFEKLSKSEMKNYQKDKCLIQGGFYKGCYIQCHNPNYPKKISLWTFFLLVELEIKPITFTTTH